MIYNKLSKSGKEREDKKAAQEAAREKKNAANIAVITLADRLLDTVS